MKQTGRYEIYYLTRQRDPDYNPGGYSILQISHGAGLARRSFLFDCNKLWRLLRHLQPDIVYQRGLNPDTGVAAYYARKFGCKAVFHVSSDHSVHTEDIKGKNNLLRRIERKVEVR